MSLTEIWKRLTKKDEKLIVNDEMEAYFLITVSNIEQQKDPNCKLHAMQNIIWQFLRSIIESLIEKYAYVSSYSVRLT